VARRERDGDLTPYGGCVDAEFGYEPLGVGWLRRKQDFATGNVTSTKPGTSSAEFSAKLLPFCHPDSTVCRQRKAMPCPICGETVEVEIDGEGVVLGSAEIRIIGDEDIYAAPDLIYHYVTAHNYKPPTEFVQAVAQGPDPDSIEFRALINALNTLA
jgi:hypothetical protein